MAKSYRPVDRDQDFLLPPSMSEWLAEDHLVWFIIAAVERLDTSAFHARARLGGVGRRGYDPGMLLTLFVYAMALGESSSRQIERLCHTDVAFRIICAQDVPDHTVLARFRKRHEEALKGLLTESLVLASELGMVSLGVVAFDGTKIAGNTAKDANRSEEYLRKLAEQYVDTVAATDAAEDERLGPDQRGDELPGSVADRTNRPRRIDQALEQIAQRRKGDQAQREAEQARARDYQTKIAQGTLGRGANNYPKGGDRVAITEARWKRERAKYAANYQRYHQQWRATGKRPPGPARLPPDEHNRVRRAWGIYQREVARAKDKNTAEPTGTATGGQGDTQDGGDPTYRANLTDPDSRLLKIRQGWIQGYNCQTSTSDDGFFITARATQDAADVGQFIPLVAELAQTVAVLARRTGRPDLAVGTMVGDAGFDSEENLTAAGPDRLIADSKAYHLQVRAMADPAHGPPPEEASPREAMNHRLRTAQGAALYRQRSHLVEAPNAWLKDRRGLRRFARRGLGAAQAELSLATAVTNLLKINTKGITGVQLKMA